MELKSNIILDSEKKSTNGLKKKNNKKNVCIGCIGLLLILFIISTFGAGSTSNKTTVDGVDFILDDNIKTFAENKIGDTTLFGFKEGMGGYITNTSDEDSFLNTLITNDTEDGYLVSKIDILNNNVEEYSFVDTDNNGNIDETGYFIVFQKDDKDFIYWISNDENRMSTDAEVEFMTENVANFIRDNKI